MAEKKVSNQKSDDIGGIDEKDLDNIRNKLDESDLSSTSLEVRDHTNKIKDKLDYIFGTLDEINQLISGTLDEISTSTSTYYKKVSNNNKKLNRIKSEIESLTGEKGWFTILDNEINKFNENYESLTNDIRNIRSQYNKLFMLYNSLNEKIQVIGNIYEELEKYESWAQNAIQKIPSGEDLKNEINFIVTSLDTIKSNLSTLNEVLRNYESITKEIENLDTTYEKVVKKVETLLEYKEGLNEKLEESKKLLNDYNEFKKNFDNLEDVLSKINNINFEKKEEELDNYIKAIDQAIEKLTPIVNKIKEMDKKYNNLKKITDNYKGLTEKINTIVEISKDINKLDENSINDLNKTIEILSGSEAFNEYVENIVNNKLNEKVSYKNNSHQVGYTTGLTSMILGGIIYLVSKAHPYVQEITHTEFGDLTSQLYVAPQLQTIAEYLLGAGVVLTGVTYLYSKIRNKKIKGEQK